MRLLSAKRYLWLPTLLALAGTVVVAALSAWSQDHGILAWSGWTHGPSGLFELILGEVRVGLLWNWLSTDSQWYQRVVFVHRDSYLDVIVSDGGWLGSFSWHLEGNRVSVSFPLLALLPLLWLWPVWGMWQGHRQRRALGSEPEPELNVKEDEHSEKA